MSIVNKTLLQKRLFGQRIKKQIIEYVRSLVEEFKHYKQVNKRFIDAFNERFKDCHAFILKNDYHDEIAFRWNQHSEEYADRPEIRVAKYHGFTGPRESIGWQDIIDGLEKYRINESIEEYKNKIANFDEDYNKIKQFKIQFDSLGVSNFSEQLYKIEVALKDIIAWAYKD